MGLRGVAVFAVGAFFVAGAAGAESPQSFIQRAVNSERAANQTDHSNWLYHDEVKKPKGGVVPWVAATQHGDVHRICQRDGQRVPDAKQRDAVQGFMHDAHAQKKSVEEDAHDAQQIDDFLKLLPVAFIWTQTSADTVNTMLHFEPDPKFHPPTREAKVFSGMVGDVVVDNQQLRVRSMSGHLTHEVTFGGGLLGRLKEGSSFALEQSQTAPSLWQLTALHVHLVGNALLFKSVSLEEDDERTKFELESPNETVEQAADLVMRQVE
jgi:hypothetical protein